MMNSTNSWSSTEVKWPVCLVLRSFLASLPSILLLFLYPQLPSEVIGDAICSLSRNEERRPVSGECAQGEENARVTKATAVPRDRSITCGTGRDGSGNPTEYSTVTSAERVNCFRDHTAPTHRTLCEPHSDTKAGGRLLMSDNV